MSILPPEPTHPSQHLWLQHHTELGMVAGLILALAYVPYITSTVRGRVRPNRVSWWMWAVLGGIAFFSYLGSGTTTALWVPALAVLGPFVIGILSLRYGTGGASGLDLFVLIGCVGGLLGWWATGSSTLALGIAIAIDALASVPTVRKSWRSPRSESLPSWLISVGGGTTNLFAIHGWTVYKASFPVYLLAMNVVVVLAIVAARARVQAPAAEAVA